MNTPNRKTAIPIQRVARTWLRGPVLDSWTAPAPALPLVAGISDTGGSLATEALELVLRGDTRAALVLARSNWAVQHEPADALVLAQAAHAAHRDAAAEPLWQFLRATGGRDVRLAVGGPAAMAFVPAAMATTQTVSRSAQ